MVIEVGKLTEKIFLLNLNSNLSSLQIGYNTRFTSVSLKTIVSVLNVLEKLILKTKLSKQQFNEFVFEMKTATCLETLELYINNLSITERQIISEPLLKLKKLTLYFAELSTLQAEELLRRVPQESCLGSLNSYKVNLSEVAVDVLISALGNLKQLSLQNCMINRKQVKEETSLESLDLSGNDLSIAFANMLASFVAKIEKVGLKGVHVIEIFEWVGQSCALRLLMVANRTSVAVTRHQKSIFPMNLEKIQLKKDDVIEFDDNGETIKATVINREKVSGNFYNYFNVCGEDGLMRNVNLERAPFRKLEFEECNMLIIPRERHSDSDCKKAMKVKLNVNDEGQYRISCRGVYWYKGDEVRARLVARGFEEKEEVPSDSPTVDKCSMRLLLIICVIYF